MVDDPIKDGVAWAPGVDPESVLVTINGKLVTDDIVLKDQDQIRLVAVVSGGK